MPDKIDAAGFVTAMLYIGVAAFLWRVGLPQLWLFFYGGWSLRGFQALRLMTGTVFSSFGAFFLWRAAVWGDLVFYDQALFGPLSVRWPAELIAATTVFLAALYASWLYGRYARKQART